MKNIYTSLSTFTLALLVSSSACAQAQLTVSQAERQAYYDLKKHVVGMPASATDAQRGGVPNDDCGGAVPVTVGATCVSTAGTLAGATQSLPPSLCSTFTSTAANDVWYSFVATASSSTIQVTGGGDLTTGVDVVLEVYSGACGAPTSLGCVDATVRGEIEQMTITTVPGTTYRYRVYYWVYATAQTVFNFTTCVTSTASYCTTSVTTCDEYIANVAFGTINNSSACVVGGAVNYTAISTNVTQGASMPITVLNGPAVYPEDQVVVWIDWNQNQSFLDAGEAYTLTSANGGATFTGTIAIPGGATLGPKRMRVRMTYNAVPAPCGASQYGEVEDYTVNVVAGGAVPANDLCTAAVNQNLAVGSNITFTGNNTGALDTEGLGFANVWHRFTTTTCTNITLSYCNTNPAFGNAFLNLFVGCPYTSFIASSSFNITTCANGNVTIQYEFVPAGTYYYAVLTDVGSVGPYSINLSAVACPTGYCTTSVTTCDEYIANVAFGAINNPSACLAGGAVNYTAISTNVTQGAIMPITVLNGQFIYPEDQVAVWVDWNQNQNFLDAGEAYTLTSADGGATFTGNIAIPATATLGPTRMRIRMIYTGTPAPCGASQYGEVEDYTVNVVAGNTPPVNDNCGGSAPHALAVGSSITLSGNNTGATVDPPTNFTLVWEQFTTTQCSNVVINYCVPGSVFTNFFVNLATNCPDILTGLLSGGNDACTVSFFDLPAGTYYIPVMVETDGSTPIGAYTIGVSATACTVAGPFCAAGASSLQFEKISNVDFAGINNASTAVAGYENFTTTTPASVVAGVSYPLTVTISGGYDTDQVLAWIDFDQNQIFEVGELVYTSAAGVGPHSGMVMIPLTATAGQTRMRVRMHDTYVGVDYFNYPNPTPCDTSTYGQVEDYTVDVVGIITGLTVTSNANFSVFPNPGNGDMTIRFSGSSSKATIDVVDMTGRTVHTQQRALNAGEAVQLSLAGALATGTYVLRVTTNEAREERRIVIR